MDYSSFLIILHATGLAISLLLPFGPQDIFILSQSMSQDKFSANMPAVITAGIVDNLLIIAAVFGLSALAIQFPWLQKYVVIIGAGVLIYLGICNWNIQNHDHQLNRSPGFSPTKQIVIALSVTLFNPYAVLDTLGVIAPHSLSYNDQGKLIFAICFMLVSWVWFIALAATGYWIQQRPNFGQIHQHFYRVGAIFMWLSAGYLMVKTFLL